MNYSRLNSQHNWGPYIQEENSHFGNKPDTQMSSDNNEGNGCGLDVDLLIILLQLRVQYPRKSGCRAKCPFNAHLS